MRRAGLTWEGGNLRDLALEATAENTSGRPAEWKIAAQGGVLESAGWPALDVQTVKMRYREPTLYVESATLHQGLSGTITVDGEVTPAEALDLHARWERMPLDALLTPDWRQHVHGTLSGETTRAHSPAPHRRACTRGYLEP